MCETHATDQGPSRTAADTDGAEASGAPHSTPTHSAPHAAGCGEGNGPCGRLARFIQIIAATESRLVAAFNASQLLDGTAGSEWRRSFILTCIGRPRHSCAVASASSTCSSAHRCERRSFGCTRASRSRLKPTTPAVAVHTVRFGRASTATLHGTHPGVRAAAAPPRRRLLPPPTRCYLPNAPVG